MDITSISLETDDGKNIELYVWEETKINGKTYLLTADCAVDDDSEEEAECYILRDDSAPEDLDGAYVIVEDETELSAVLGIFKSLVDDVSIEE